MIAMDLVRAAAMASIVVALAAGVLTFWQIAAAFVERSGVRLLQHRPATMEA